MKTKVIAYTRVSTGKQADKGLSLEAQKDKLVAYAKLYDLEIVAFIEDAGVSAKTLEREGLNKALAMLQNTEADSLLIAKLDRLTRSVRDLSVLIEQYFSVTGLISVNDHIDTRSPQGRLILNILTSVAQWEREETSDRTKAALEVKKNRGEYYGGKVPWGFSLAEDGRTLVENAKEREAEILVREYKALGDSLRHIAQKLFEGGYVARNGGVLSAQAVKNLLEAG